MKKVFIAGPYTLGDVAQNVKLAMDMANDLINLGFAPYCPHLTHFLHMNHFQPYEKWLELDLVYLASCEAIIRLPGKSDGADGEVNKGQDLGIPVFYDLESLIQAFQ
jgi:Domain of unknown function (DUF4406)